MTLLRKSVPIQSENNPFLALQNEINKAMGDFYNIVDLPRLNLDRFENLNLTPAIDIVDTKDSFKLEFEMPGMDEKDIKVSISEGMITVKGEKSVSRKDKDKNYMRREISYGCYERSIPIPESADASKAKASFKKGMLWIDMPKKGEVAKQAKELKIEKASD